MIEKVELTKAGKTMEFPKVDAAFMIKSGWKEVSRIATPAPAPIIPAATLAPTKEVVKNG